MFAERYNRYNMEQKKQEIEFNTLKKKQGKYKNILNNLLDIGGIDQAIYSHINGSKSFDIFSKFGGEINRKVLQGKFFEVRMEEKDLIQLSIMLKKARTADEIYWLFDRFSERLFKTKMALLRQRKYFEQTKKELIIKIENKIKKQRTRWLQYINDAKNVNVQENVWPIHIATLFISIKTKKRELYAPLLLRPVSIDLDGKKIIMKSAGEWIINEKLLFILNNQGQKLRDDFSLKGMSGLEAIKYSLIQWKMKEIFTPYGVFKNKKKETITNKNFIQHHGIVLGFFKPNGGQLRKTMFKIIQNNQVNKVLLSNRSHKSFEEKISEYIKKNAKKIVRIEPNNYSQDKALISSLIQDTIIWGPPGTGKSQVISNLIANILYKGKTAVVMSQKKAALDVLKSRLGPLAQFALFLLNDNNFDKKNFYKPLQKLSNTFEKVISDNNKNKKHFSYDLINEKEISAVNILYKLEKTRNKEKIINNAKINGIFPNSDYGKISKMLEKNVEKKLDTDFLVDFLSKRTIDKIWRMRNEEPERYEKFIQCEVEINNMKMMPINFMEEYMCVLKDIFPIIITTPETSFVTWEKHAYDYSILDESSQMFLEIGLPVLYIGRIKVLVGDQQQMKPSRWFSSREDADGGKGIPEDAESLLDYGFDKNMYPVMLNKNYRSSIASLMSFSAKNFYESKLDVINSSKAKDDAIEVINVEGSWEGGINKVEINETIKIAQKNIGKFEKVIILAFNGAQRTMIEKIIIGTKPKLYRAIRDEKLLIRNIENIQGDEADLVIISVVYTSKTNMGSTYVSRTGGRNALNVALSRAKDKMIIIKSITYDTVRNANSSDFKTFKEWLRFLDLSDKEQKEYSLVKKKRKIKSKANLFNFKADIFKKAKESCVNNKTMEIVMDYPIGSKSIDVAILNLKGEILLGIDADKYEYAKRKGFDDYLESSSRLEFLKVKGYPMISVRLYEWLLDSEKIIENFRIEVNKSN